MEGRDDAEGQEDRPSSPYWALQQISEEAFRVAGEALQSVYNGSPSLSPLAPGHRRSQSEVMTAGHRRSNSLQRLKVQMQKAWRWGSNLQEESPRSNFNPEILANQKRQWYQLHSKTMDNSKFKEPTSLFEHFIIAGLQSDTNLEVVEDAFARRKRWESEMAKSETLDFGLSQYRGPSPPALEPQILFKYPPTKRLPMRLKDLAAFCFPGGVQARLLERTPSLSDLNELVYGQELLEIILDSRESKLDPLKAIPILSGKTIKSAKHYAPDYGHIIAQERLNRITQFVNEMALTTYIPSDSNSHEEVNENASYSPDSSESQADWTTSAIPLHSAIALTAAAAGLVPDDGVTSPSLKNWEPQSPESVTTSETSELSHSRESDRDGAKSSLYIDDNTSEASESRFNSSGRMNGCYGNGHASPDVGAFFNLRSRTMERLGSPDSLFSPVRSLASEDEDDDLFTNSDKDVGDDVIMDWARAIEYHRPPVSALGLPEVCLDLLEPAEVNAKMAAAEEALALSIWTTATTCRVLSLESVNSSKKLLSSSILAVFAGVLLEKQVVLTCPNLETCWRLGWCRLWDPQQLASLLGLIVAEKSMTRSRLAAGHPIAIAGQWLPWGQWLPSHCTRVLPGRMLDFLEAPVPFIVGVQQKPADFKIKTSNLVHVNVLKDQVKMCHLPTLPQYRELISQLRPIHARLSCENSIARRHPVYRCNEVQAEAAARFLTVMRNYLESLCSELRSHTITSVQSNNDRVSLLLKDSFIDSFPNCDRAFIKLLVDTQMFSALSDARLSTYESMRF
ncbi:hypothetical protein CDL15_Pgr006578 [Punica granatum]|uniref:cDENN domain-containing protein n=1 Tax=Punica granatum TaxID=22663 RepID=A0A218XYX1_PUNGR|nr:hypothetical protein CDL15_Pgr006578 [Punica granatum]